MRPLSVPLAAAVLSLGSIGGGFAVPIPGRRGALMEPDNGNGAPAGSAGGAATATAPASAAAAPVTQSAGAAVTQAAPPANTQAAGLPSELQAFQPVIDAVRQNVSGMLAPVNQQIADLSNRLQAATQPQAGVHPSQVFGGGNTRAPGVASGPTWGKLEAGGYQYMRAYGATIGHQYVSNDAAKFELSLSDRLYKHYVQNAGMALAGNKSILVPYGSAAIFEFEQGFAAEVQQMLAAGIRGADPAEMRQMAARGLVQQGMSAHAAFQQTLSMFDDTALGAFVGATGGAELIELVRNREWASRAGATQLTLPPSGYLKMNRQTGACTGYWVGENTQINTSEPTTGTLELRARKAAARVTFPNELLRFATPSVEAFLRSDIARVLALMIDLAALEGPGTTNTPRGILNHTGVVSYTAGTVATNGNTFEPEDPARMVAELEERNHDTDVDPATFVMRSKMWTNVLNRRADAVSAADAAGPWLFTVNRNDINAETAPRLIGKQVIRSGQVSNTRVKGASSDLSYILLGIMRHLLIANHGVMEFATSVQGDTVFANDQTQLRAIRHVDVGLRYEDAFAVCDSVDMDLPA